MMRPLRRDHEIESTCPYCRTASSGSRYRGGTAWCYDDYCNGSRSKPKSSMSVGTAERPSKISKVTALAVGRTK